MRCVLANAIIVLCAAVSFGQVPGIEFCGPADPAESLKSQAIVAVAENPSEATPAIDALRQAGPAGFDAFLAAHKEQIDKHLVEGSADSADAQWQRIKAALDSIAGQRDCYASKLYWFTDLEQAKAAAKAAGKPILSLRLLGKLTDEFSCANSR